MTGSTRLQEILATATAAAKAGDYKAAVVAFRQAHDITPDIAGIVTNLGVATLRAEGPKAAASWLMRAAAMKPDAAEAQARAGHVLAHLRRFDDARPYLTRALAIDPGNLLALQGSAMVAEGSGDRAGARTFFEGALARNPNLAEAWFHLGILARSDGDAVTALRHFETAIKINPADARYHLNAGLALDMAGRHDEARDRIDQALGLDPSHPLIWSSKAMWAINDATLSPRAVADLHRACQSAYAARGWQRPAKRPTQGRRIRLGYVAADFYSCVGACQLLSLLQAHDRSRFEIFCYVTNAVTDDVTKRFHALADHWRPIHDLSDDAAAALVIANGIDILIDFCGHAEGARLGLFARTPAPVAVSIPGYVATTGLTAIDHRVTDRISDPNDDAQACYAEHLIWLPEGHFSYAPLMVLPPIAPSPVQRTGKIAFGSFHKRLKYNSAVFDTWASVLTRVPDSTLVLKDRQFDHDSACRETRAEFVARGIDPDRVIFRGHVPTTIDHYRAYDAVDIALDPFPWNGTTTTIDALFMGVPVVALRGDRHVSRLAANILTRVGLPELVAETREAYVEIAARLAADVDRRTRLRHELRGMVEASPIIQAHRVVRPLEEFFLSVAGSVA